MFRAVSGNRQRSGLTVLGIAIGIAAVALLTSVGEGLRLYVMDSFSQFGTRIIAVSPGKVTTQGMAGILSSTKPLRIEDAEALRGLPYVDAVVSVVSGTGRVEYGRMGRDTNVMGVSHQAAMAWQIAVSQGRFLPADDPVSARAYAVLGAKLKRELFGAASPLGERIRVGGARFRVVGVMEEKGQLLGFDLDDVVYIPASRGLQLFNRTSLMEVDIIFDERANAADMSRRIRERLTQLHGREDFTLFTQQDMLGSLDNILRILTLVVAALGGISLLVGGVGVLTIMTTALQERTAEIGLLAALGCTARQIMALFLGEAIMLAAAGGIAGIALVVLVISGAKLMAPDLPLALNPLYLFLALLLSMGVGLVSGIAPAIRAAGFNPIEALRDE